MCRKNTFFAMKILHYVKRIVMPEVYCENMHGIVWGFLRFEGM